MLRQSTQPPSPWHAARTTAALGCLLAALGTARAELPVPPEWYSSFARWHRLSLMRNPRTLRDMREVMRNARDPHRLANLIALVEDEMGYRLYQTVSAAKAALSSAEVTRLSFHHKDLAIDAEITREQFEGWIAGDMLLGDAVVKPYLEGQPGWLKYVASTAGALLVVAVGTWLAKRAVRPKAVVEVASNESEGERGDVR